VSVDPLPAVDPVPDGGKAVASPIVLGVGVFVG
jgi:hypothetical protein